MKPNFQSLKEIKKAILQEEYSALIVLKGAGDFLRDAVSKDDREVKLFLIQFVQEHLTSPAPDQQTVSFALGWLGQYMDPELLPFFINLLTNEQCEYSVLQILATQATPAMAHYFIERIPTVQHPGDLEFLLSSLANTGSEEGIHVLINHLQHPNFNVQGTAAASLLKLGKILGQETVITSVLPLLNHPNRWLRERVAYNINLHFSKKFYELGLDAYLPEHLRVHRNRERDS